MDLRIASRVQAIVSFSWRQIDEGEHCARAEDRIPFFDSQMIDR